MKVLVACEESGAVRDAFRDMGHKAYSNDIQESESQFHIKGDCMKVIPELGPWDLIIMHPPCDHLALSGNRWYGRDCEGEEKRTESIAWTLDLWELAKKHANRVALENPASVIFPFLAVDVKVQYIQPYEFGHEETKKTGFALHNLPLLYPTKELIPPRLDTPEYLEWQKVWRMGPSEDRKKLRSKTYDGIARAMAEQWGTIPEDMFYV
jgi:hypothetical protein